MGKIIAILTVAMSQWIAYPTAVRADGAKIEQSAQVNRLVTTSQAMQFLSEKKGPITREAFGRWSGATRKTDAFGDYWLLADGTLQTNCLELRKGVFVISCWGRKK
jgi:hypothetical protein